MYILDNQLSDLTTLSQKELRERYFDIKAPLSASLIKEYQQVLEKFPFSKKKVNEILEKQDFSKCTTALALGDLIHKIEENPDYIEKLVILKEIELLPKEKEILNSFMLLAKENKENANMLSLMRCYCTSYNNATTRLINEIGFQELDSMETYPKDVYKTFEKVQELWETISPYVESYFNVTEGQIILNDLFDAPQEILQILTSIPEILQENEFYQHLLSLGQSTKEMVILWKTEDNIAAKSMLDRFIIDHKNKKIIYLDVKTCGDGRWLFLKNYVKFSYYQQMAIYRDALNYLISKDVDYKDFTIEVYILGIYYNIGYSEIFKVSSIDLDTGKFGGKFKIKGYETILYKRNGFFEIEMTHASNYDFSVDGIEAADFLNHLPGYERTLKTLKQDYNEAAFGIYKQFEDLSSF